jgi:hypothetical protein
MQHAREPGGREDKRQRDRLSQHLPGGVHRRDVGQRPRHEAPAPERRDVASEAQLLVGGAVNVIEHRPRDHPPRAAAQVRDVVAAGKPATCRTQLGRAHPYELADL